MSSGTKRLDWKKTKRRVREPATFTKPEFLELKAEWYQKLRATGFKDLEYHYIEGDTTSALMTEPFSNLRKAYRPQTVFYFQKAGWYLHHGTFKTPKEKRMWAQHVIGATHRAIGAQEGMKHQNVTTVLLRIKKRMMADARYEKEEAEEIAKKAARFDFVVKKVVKDDGNE